MRIKNPARAGFLIAKENLSFQVVFAADIGPALADIAFLLISCYNINMKTLRRKFKKYFIPHKENDYKPHLLRPRTIAFICLVMVIAEAAFLIGPSYVATRSKLFGVILVNALVDGTNQSRVANDLPALTVNPLLQAAAQEKADDMVKNNYFAHTSPTGITPWYWFENVGYNFAYAGENLAVNFSDSQDVTNAWMNSPEHRANILNANYTDIGMAIATGTFQGQPAVYVVELFGTPAAPFAFVNTAAAATVQTPVPAPTVTSKPVAKVPSKPVQHPVPPVPVIVASSALSNSSSQESFVAVKGAEIQSASSGIAQTSPAAVVRSDESVAPQSNPVQEAAASPRQLGNDFYLFLIIVIGIALLLNIFIEVRIQYPQLIFGGVSAIAVAALFVVLNQHLLLAHGVVF